MQKIIEKIDKCDFCGLKAEYWYKKSDLFSFKWGYVCEQHKQEFLADRFRLH